jgi:hypothetical protein
MDEMQLLMMKLLEKFPLKDAFDAIIENDGYSLLVLSKNVGEYNAAWGRIVTGGTNVDMIMNAYFLHVDFFKEGTVFRSRSKKFQMLSFNSADLTSKIVDKKLNEEVLAYLEDEGA